MILHFFIYEISPSGGAVHVDTPSSISIRAFQWVEMLKLPRQEAGHYKGHVPPTVFEHLYNAPTGFREETELSVSSLVLLPHRVSAFPRSWDWCVWFGVFIAHENEWLLNIIWFLKVERVRIVHSSQIAKFVSVDGFFQSVGCNFNGTQTGLYSVNKSLWISEWRGLPL